MDGGNVILSSIKMLYVERCREMKLENARARGNIQRKEKKNEKNVKKTKPKKKREKEKD